MSSTCLLFKFLKKYWLLGDVFDEGVDVHYVFFVVGGALGFEQTLWTYIFWGFLEADVRGDVIFVIFAGG